MSSGKLGNLALRALIMVIRILWWAAIFVSVFYAVTWIQDVMS